MGCDQVHFSCSSFVGDMAQQYGFSSVTTKRVCHECGFKHTYAGKQMCYKCKAPFKGGKWSWDAEPAAQLEPDEGGCKQPVKQSVKPQRGPVSDGDILKILAEKCGEESEAVKAVSIGFKIAREKRMESKPAWQSLQADESRLAQFQKNRVSKAERMEKLGKEAAEKLEMQAIIKAELVALDMDIVGLEAVVQAARARQTAVLGAQAQAVVLPPGVVLPPEALLLQAQLATLSSQLNAMVQKAVSEQAAAAKAEDEPMRPSSPTPSGVAGAGGVPVQCGDDLASVQVAIQQLAAIVTKLAGKQLGTGAAAAAVAASAAAAAPPAAASLSSGARARVQRAPSPAAAEAGERPRPRSRSRSEEHLL